MAQPFLRAIAHHGRISALRTLTTSSRCAAAQYPDASYVQTMPDDIDYHYPRLGNRDVVGYGLNGFPTYHDMCEQPFPAVRFRENLPEIMALREKGKGDWKNLTLAEKKALYRADFCQTFAEIKAPTGEWRTVWAGVFFALALSGWGIIFLNLFVYPERPHTITKEWQEKQVEKLIKQRQGHVTGVASLWDYEKGQWK